MYGLPDRYLVENPIKRYSIGSSTPGLKMNDDGTLVICVSAKSPGGDKESNWLPAPSGPFWTVLRNYGPAEEIINGSYRRPEYVAQETKQVTSGGTGKWTGRLHYPQSRPM